MRRGPLFSIAAAGVAAAAMVPGISTASHSPSGGAQHDFVAGSGTNEFLIAVGEAHLSAGAQSDPSGTDPTGHVRAKGNVLPGLTGPFKLEGEVTCLRVEPNLTGPGTRAAIKYRFKHAEGSAEPFEGGGVQIFLEDNGDPRGGEPVDRATFDPPQDDFTFNPTAGQCDSPNSKFTYDQIESGNFVVHDAP